MRTSQEMGKMRLQSAAAAAAAGEEAGRMAAAIKRVADSNMTDLPLHSLTSCRRALINSSSTIQRRQAMNQRE